MNNYGKLASLGLLFALPLPNATASAQECWTRAPSICTTHPLDGHFACTSGRSIQATYSVPESIDMSELPPGISGYYYDYFTTTQPFDMDQYCQSRYGNGMPADSIRSSCFVLVQFFDIDAKGPEEIKKFWFPLEDNIRSGIFEGHQVRVSPEDLGCNCEFNQCVR